LQLSNKKGPDFGTGFWLGQELMERVEDRGSRICGMRKAVGPTEKRLALDSWTDGCINIFEKLRENNTNTR
jgi:hypothetical protein